MLTTYRRHKKDCAHRAEGRKYRRCKCPIWVDGFLAGQDRFAEAEKELEKAISISPGNPGALTIQVQSPGNPAMLSNPVFLVIVPFTLKIMSDVARDAF